MASAPLVKMSQLARLSGVPAPTIKHYIREGLLPGPARRTSKNMAYYDSSLAERVRVIKDLQQTQFLPLRVIGEMLKPAPSAALKKSSARLQTLIPAIRAGQGSTVSSPRRTVDEVLQSMQVSKSELDQLERMGLVQPVVPDKGTPYYCGADLDLISIVSETRERGLGAFFTFDILPPYVAHIRTLVRFELELFRSRVLDGKDVPAMSLADFGRDATALGERMMVALHKKLVLPEVELLMARPTARPKTKAKPAPKPKPKAKPAPKPKAKPAPKPKPKPKTKTKTKARALPTTTVKTNATPKPSSKRKTQTAKTKAAGVRGKR